MALEENYKQKAPFTGVFRVVRLLQLWSVQKLLQSDRKRLGQNILSHRTKLGLTQEQLAERAGIDRRFIQKVEAGELGASLAVLKRLRKTLKTQWDSLLDGI